MAEDDPNHTSPTAWDGVGISLLHDVGKVGELTKFAVDSHKKGVTLSHKKLHSMLSEAFQRYKIQSTSQVPKAWFRLIKEESRPESNIVTAAHKLADRVSKHIQGESYSRLEDQKWKDAQPDAEKKKLRKIDRDVLPTYFYPYYGAPKLWAGPQQASEEADQRFEQICRKLSIPPTLPSLLVLQEQISDFPHSRYVPHLSLQLHDLFSASLFYFAYLALKKLDATSQLHEFTFYIVEVTPNLLDVFYRLRDVVACSATSRQFYVRAVANLFSPWEQDLPGVSSGGPFMFYCSGGFVFLYPEIEAARPAIQAALKAAPGLRSVDLRATRYSVTVESLRPVTATIQASCETLSASTLFAFQRQGGERCEVCQRIVAGSELAEDDHGNLLCQACLELRKTTSGVDVDRVSRAAESSNRVAYVFLTLPPELRAHASKTAAEKIIPEFWAKLSLPSEYQIPSTQGGIYEYLQAVRAIRCLDADIEREIRQIQGSRGENGATVLFLNLSSKAVVLHEEYVWDFLERIYDLRKQLQLECSVRAVICPSKTPFWSLIELATKHKAGDILWDVSREAIHMFSDTEITTIRNLARDAQRYRTQLNALSKIALQTTLEELLLEMDYRRDRLREFQQRLKGGIQTLQYEDNERNSLKAQEKRAVFFKYIAGLTR